VWVVDEVRASPPKKRLSAPGFRRLSPKHSPANYMEEQSSAKALTIGS
jgi:hypothetical protein